MDQDMQIGRGDTIDHNFDDEVDLEPNMVSELPVD
jgi:hypothetical protein